MTVPAPELPPLAEQGEFPDPEIVAADILAAVEVGGAPLGRGLVDTDVSDLDLDDVRACVRAYVPPGRRSLSRYGDLDTAFVYVQAWAQDRRTSQHMIQQVRRLLDGFRDGGVHRGVQVFRVTETTGPGQLPMQPNEDDRCVESGWTFQLRRHRGPTVR